MANENPFGVGGVKEHGIQVVKNGSIVDTVNVDSVKNFESGQTGYRYTDSEGNTKYTNSVYDLPMSISLNTDTGNIKISAPKAIVDLPEFKQTFNTEKLKEYSQAYKLNPEYKVPYAEKNEDGEEVATEISIPDFVAKLNDAFVGKNGFVDNLKLADKQREEYRKKYGSNVDNWSYTQLQQTMDINSGYVYVPKFLLDGALSSLKSKADADGRVSVEDFREAYYNRDNVGRQELVELNGQIDVALKNSAWGDDTFENGDENVYSTEELSKALNLKNYIQSVDPDAEWYQQFGDNIVSFGVNAMYGCTRVFENILNLGEAAVTLGNGHGVQTYINEMDASVDKWNQENLLVNDATATLSWLGQIGGAMLFSFGASAVTKAALNTAAGALGAYASSYAEAVSAVENMGPSAQAALTVETMSAITSQVENISRGASLMLKMASVAEKAQWAKGVYYIFKAGHKGLGYAVEFVVDTVHDALLYDSVSLREALEASDQETRDYWLGQVADNGKWWIGMAAAKGAVKGAGKTNLGKTLNAYAVKYINKLAANIGDKKAAMKDKVAGGSLIESLEKKLEDATKKKQTKTARRLANKIEQTKWNKVLRDARRGLGSVELDKKTLTQLTDESSKKFVESVSAVKSIENAIDNYNRNIMFKRQEMLGLQKDPSTGRVIYINPELGGANTRVTDFYMKLSDLGSQYGLKSVQQGWLSQDMIDYMMGSYHADILTAFVNSGGSNAAKAADALEIVRRNVNAAKAALPEEIVSFIDNNRRAYTEFYAALNNYGKAHSLVDVDKITSYENNPIWSKNGYMPIKVEQDLVGGQWITEDGRVHALIEQDFNTLKFEVSDGQHYVDPEMVRQTRINHMAQAENNLSILKAYSQIESAANITRVSGQETKYAQEISKGRAHLEETISTAKISFAETGLFDITTSSKPTKVTTKVKSKNYTKAERTAGVSGLSYSETRQILIQRGVVTENRPYLTSDVTIDGYDDWYNGLSDSAKNYLKQEYDKYGQDGFDGLLTAIETGGDTFEAGLQRAYLLGDDSFMKSDLLKMVIANQKDGKAAFYDGVVKSRIIERLNKISGIDAKQTVDTLSEAIERDIDGYVDLVLNDAGARSTIDAMSKTTNGSALNAKYYALKQLQDNPKLAYESLDKYIDEIAVERNLGAKDAAEIKTAAHDLLDDIIYDELSSTRHSLKTVNSALLDDEDVFEEVNRINNEIKKADEEISSRDSSVIMYLDEQGRQVYAETDPAFASLFNCRYRMDKGEASALAKFNAATSKLFRFGTTSVNLSSFGNQLFRDFGNALLVGGAWQTIKTNADNLVDVFGENIVEQIKRFDPTGYEMKQVEQIAEATGQTIEQAAVSRELSRGAAISPSTTERTLYRDFMKEAYGSNSNELISKAKTKLQNIVDKYNPEDLLNGKRENYLRNRVFASAYNDAFTNGYTMEQARTFAEFAMNNATTNFSRQLYHMQAIADSTPYFKAGINGTKSFWRMWSLDPVGISGRIMGGLVLPTIYLTGMSVADPENREIYKNIPEYQKDNSLVFVVNGSVISVPMPQEISGLIAPYRQFVEYLWDANKNDFWELMMNDALGMSPVDFTGFSTIDMNTMISEPTLADRINRGFARVFSQMAPVGIKTGYMLAFKSDPYTGKNISDPSYQYWDYEAGDYVTVDYTQNEFAKVFSSWFGGRLGMSPALAEKLLSGIFGATTTNVLSDITALCKGGFSQAAEETFTNIGTQLGKPFSVDVYNQADSMWRLSIRQLTAEKEQILNSREMQTLNSQLSQEKDPEKRKTLLAKRQDLVNDFQKKVTDTVKRLQSEYGGTYDRKKFAATYTLLNFNADTSYQSGSQYSSDLANSQYWDGRDEAIHTMERFGIVGTNDMSIFGYLKKNSKTGEIEVAYNNPVAIIDAENQWGNMKDIHLANIKALVSTNDLWSQKDAVDDQVSAIYAKGKLSNSDYDAIDAIYVDWNAQVMKAVAPYVESMTPEAAINNTQVLNYLAGLVEVPGDYKKDKYGRYVTNKKLGEGSAKQAYVRNYIKSIFKINDTGYASGRNYSNRKSVGDK